MQSMLRSRALILIVSLTVLAALGSCASVDRHGREAVLTKALTDLLPDGRVYPNDLSATRRVEVRGAWLFGDDLLVEDAHGRILSLDRRSLDPRWYYAGLPGPLDFPPAVSAKYVALVSGGKLYEVDRRWGDVRHSPLPLRFIPSAGPAVNVSTAFVPALAAGEGNRTLTTVNLADGLEGWGIATRGSISSSPVLGGSGEVPMLYFATDAQAVFALPARSAVKGTPDAAWSMRTHGRIVGSPVLSEDLVLVGTESGDLWALNRITGEPQWVKYSERTILHAPWVAGDRVFFVNEAGFHALERDTGKDLWSFPGRAAFVVRREKAVVVALEDGTALALDPDSGTVLRRVKFGKGVRFLANSMDGMLYLVTRGGFVFAVGKKLP